MEEEDAEVQADCDNLLRNCHLECCLDCCQDHSQDRKHFHVQVVVKVAVVEAAVVDNRPLVEVVHMQVVLVEDKLDRCWVDNHHYFLRDYLHNCFHYCRLVHRSHLK